MKDISCKIIEDLLPLYNDHVCSEESRSLVEEHLTTCTKCQEILAIMKSDIERPSTIDDAAAIKVISKKWKSDQLTSLLWGGFIVSILSSAASFMMFNLKGSYVAPDGRLVESFGFLPIGFLLAFISFVFGLVLAARSVRSRLNQKKQYKTLKKSK